MTAQAIPIPVAQNSPAWLDARRNVIGSSDIPTLTGTSPYRTSKLSLWAIKTRLLEPEPVDPEDQERYDLGHALEDDIAERCPHIKPIRPRAGLFVHPAYSWLGASLDRYNRRERVVHELKWLPYRNWREGPEPVPAYVQDQVQQQTLVMGDGWRGHVTCLQGQHIECYDVEPDKGYQDDLLYIAGKFREDHIVTGIPPAIDGSEETRRTLLRLHPRDTLGFIEPTAEIEALVRDLCVRTAAFEIEEAEVRRLKNALRGVLEEHAGVQGDGWKVTYRKSKDSEKDVTDWQSVAKAYRLLLERAFGHDGRSEADALIDLGYPLDADVLAVLDPIETVHTNHVVTDGPRPLRGPWEKETTRWQ